MPFVIKRIFSLAVLSILTASGSLLLANTVTDMVSVSGTTMPWVWVNGGLNTAFQFGIQDGTAPVVIDAGSGISFASGAPLTITFMSGTSNADTLTGSSNVDAQGYVPGTPVVPYTANNGPGTSGDHFPSLYMSPYPIYLNELVGVFTNSLGSIVGTPFAIGDSLVNLVIPTGATQIQLGINDDIFYDNAGTLSVDVQGEDPPPVPEPATFLLIGVPLVALGVFQYRKRRCW